MIQRRGIRWHKPWTASIKDEYTLRTYGVNSAALLEVKAKGTDAIAIVKRVRAVPRMMEALRKIVEAGGEQGKLAEEALKGLR